MKTNFIKAIKTSSENKLITVSNYLLLFYVAAITGFLWEISLYLMQGQGFCKRGFFYGPWLPVYGCGAVMIYFFLNKQKDHPAICFCFSGLIGAAVELFTGWLLFTFFHARYWDYTGLFLNVSGYICLYSVLGFSVAGTALVCFIAPRLLALWSRFSLSFRLNLITALLLLFAIDLAVALLEPNKGKGITF